MRNLSWRIKYAKAKKTKVLAVLVSESGRQYFGVNVESSCHSLSICAERAAVFSAVTNEGPDMKIVSLDVYAERRGDPIEILPCGGCRQVIGEFSTEKPKLMGKPMEYWMPNPYK